MNTPEYRKAYLANLKLDISNNTKIEQANKGNPVVKQYIQNGGQIIGASAFKCDTIIKTTNTQSKQKKYMI